MGIPTQYLDESISKVVNCYIWLLTAKVKDRSSYKILIKDGSSFGTLLRNKEYPLGYICRVESNYLLLEAGWILKSLFD